MENKHNKAVTIFLVVVIVLLVAGLGVMTYFVIDLNKKGESINTSKTNNQNVVENNKQDSNKTDVNTNSNANNELNNSKVENKTQDNEMENSTASSRVYIDYTRAAVGTIDENLLMYKSVNFEGIVARLVDAHTVSFSYVPNTVRDIYGSQLKNVEESIDSKSFDIKFENKEVVDIFIEGIGQSKGFETLFFLISDGTLEYMPIPNAIANKKFQSYGKIEGVKDVIKLAKYSIGKKNVPGGTVSLLAITDKGTYYVLDKLIENKNYYYMFEDSFYEK